MSHFIHTHTDLYSAPNSRLRISASGQPVNWLSGLLLLIFLPATPSIFSPRHSFVYLYHILHQLFIIIFKIIFFFSLYLSTLVSNPVCFPFSPVTWFSGALEWCGGSCKTIKAWEFPVIHYDNLYMMYSRVTVWYYIQSVVVSIVYLSRIWASILQYCQFCNLIKL